nr:MAG TPA: hypothetical protein [Caudoviricetes sp.]
MMIFFGIKPLRSCGRSLAVTHTRSSISKC